MRQKSRLDVSIAAALMPDDRQSRSRISSSYHTVAYSVNPPVILYDSVSIKYEKESSQSFPDIVLSRT